ncbi:hypothetical protein Taro_007490 [Colocasia esculenta]|uniref:Pentatricopeptide repeat-containing protein n=1 Tax=Colocasia esculenta TaxID=4460 RepID=A0A843TZ33_COLES|nr:hypothetical protein [Colocasia esculenta]
MVAASPSISALHARLVKTRDPNALCDLLLLLPPSNSTPSAAAASNLSYARAVFADYAPAAHAFPWNAIIRAHALIPAYFPDALALFASMHRHGVPTDRYTFPLVLRACSLHPSPPTGLRAGTSAHALAIKCGLLNSIVHSCNAFIAFYGRHGLLGHALQLFGEMPRGERDVVSWSTLVACMASSGYHAEALEGFRLMQASGVSPDEPAMVSATWAAGNLGAAELAAWAYCYARKGQLRITVALGTALVVALARCGWIKLAKRMFDEMPERNLITWTAMIHGLAAHGRGPESLEMFHRMVLDGFKPDHVAFIGALTACSRGGLLEEGIRLFESMERDHGVAPQMEHYGCMVDLMGRAGLLAEAYEFVKRMPGEPGPVVWRTLLGACVSHGYVELAEQVKEKISELEPGHDGDYVLLSNVYGGIGRWGEKEGVRSEMRGRRVGKTPGLSVPSL